MSLSTLWLYLHFPSLQIDSLFLNQAACNQDEQQAVIVINGQKNIVVQANDHALQQGIHLGMGLGSAASLCRELCVHAYDPEIERKKLLEIAHWLYLVTSDISLCGSNGLLLRVSNMLSLYDGLTSYWQTLKQHLEKQQVHYQYASAYSPLAAELLARSGLNLISDERKQVLAHLKQQKLSESRLPDKQIERLQRVGIRDMQALLAVPSAELAKRFDLSLVNYVGQLTGTLPQAVHFYHPPMQFSRYLELLFELSNLQLLEKPLLRLLNALEEFLRIQNLYAYELKLQLHLRDKGFQEVFASSAKGDYLAKVWLDLFSLRFESVKVPSPVIGITISAHKTKAKHEESMDFFEGGQRNGSSLELISTLQAKLGPDSIKNIDLVDDPRPELSTCLRNYQNRPIKKGMANHLTIDKAKLRPSLLFPKPKVLRERVTLIEGPERIATGWWDEQNVIRDYFIARAHSGAWLWVFRTPEQRWYLHGVFA
ncbi:MULTISPECIES: DNA polymerase Y family protein [unclassified Oleiphilus]|jgi:protein ImuB|nr:MULTISPECIES: DNA polymerase Y family protein [unclassified Oleiphilus]KZY84793.1 hypothetical protein A3741_15940 [Oleiphilus sp. HI0069]KZY91792.1 hypothetical protein A3743_06875 [Oleiphilus sp. HI0072]KZZ31864.1 hypothetical protein A3755_10995 [Oleiphilus sp. HI0085]KZY30827.1 hypothetical protein A3729_10395 [Oleiphilus sp. HI0043]KZY58991.1 hypothetical protein A3735_16460 [Oleiphilus sp. HI0061]